MNIKNASGEVSELRNLLLDTGGTGDPCGKVTKRLAELASSVS